MRSKVGTEDTLDATPAEARTVPVEPAAAAPSDDPRQIGRYHVLERLGKGGMGVVYAAYDPELDRKVAIKLIYADGDAGKLHRSQDLLRREAQALARLAHPNIVAIHDVGVHAGQVFVAMEFVAGRSMRQWLEERGPGWQEVLAAMIQAGRGIVAAHAAGLIHRDIKPDNLLLGDDGRVRVADFGIARHDPSVMDTTGPSVAGARELMTVAGRGSIVGTPAYMPPEQHDGGVVGPHSDQFSFCVTLWEGLYGGRPFVGDSQALPERIRAGVPTRPVGAPELPAWLDQAIRRGMSPRAADRWPSMQALLDVLALDLEARRARMRWRMLYAALVAVGAVALVLGGRALQASWRRAALERAAEERLVVVGTSVGRMLAKGLRAEAEETLRGFVQEPELRDTRAALDAWLLWADHMDALGDRAAAQSAVVEAYALLPEDDPGEPALALRIARQFRGAWKFDELAALGEQVAERWPAEARAPAWAELRADAALARADFDGFLAVVGAGAGREREALVPLVRALATASCPLAGDYHARLTDWPGSTGREVIIQAHEFIAGKPTPASMRRMDPALTPVGPELSGLPLWAPPTDNVPLVLTPGGPTYLVGYSRADRALSLLELDVGGVREVLRWEDDLSAAGAAADLDGDGLRELYLGTGTYTRKLYRLDRDAQGAWTRRPAHPPTDAIGSDINSLVPGDFDGDGREELAAAVGAWRAYDVRIFEAAPEGGLRVAARKRFGHVRAMQALRGADGSTLLALVKDDTARSKEAWAPGEPQGDGEGLHVVRRHGDGFATLAYFPWPAQVDQPHPTDASHVIVGDFDGDGLQDVVVPVGWSYVTMQLLRQRPDGSFAEAQVGGVVPLVAGNFDADPADELLVSLRRGGSARLCVLGVDGESFSPGPAGRRAAETPALADPLLARVWTRAENLAGFGLFADAARALASRVTLAGDEADRRALQRRSAELDEAAGQFGRAAEGFEALALAGDGAAALRAVHDFEEDLRFSDALRVAEAALRTDRLDAAQVAELRAAQARVKAVEGRTARVDVTFDGPLDPAWQILEPLALRLDPVRGELLVDATADMAAIATLPVELTGEPLTVELDLEVERADWGTQLGAVVRSPDGAEQAIELLVTAGGGGGYLNRNNLFGPFHVFGAWETESPSERSSHRLRGTVLPAYDRIVMRQDGSRPVERRDRVERQVRPGPHVLVLRSSGLSNFESQQIRGRLRRISLLGARPASGGSMRQVDMDMSIETRDRVGRELVHGRWRGALAADDGAAAGRLWRGVALAELGRAEAVAVFAGLDAAAPETRRSLRYLLRTRHATFGPVLRAALGPGYGALLLEALQKKGEYPDEELTALRLAMTADIEGLPDGGDAAVRAGLLAIRGGAWKSAGALAEAEADLAAAAELMAAGLAIRGEASDAALATIELRRAEVAAGRGRVDEALAAVGRALGCAPDPGWMAERLRISGALARLKDDPRWQASLAPYP